MLCTYFKKIYCSLPSIRNTKRLFFTLYHENLMMLLEAYLWKCGIYIKIRYSRVFTLNLICIHPPAICLNDCLSFPTSWWLQKYLIHIGWNLAVFLHFSWDSLCLPVFQISGWRFVLPLIFDESEESHLFSVCQFFPCSKGESNNFQALYKLELKLDAASCFQSIFTWDELKKTTNAWLPIWFK